MKKETEAPRPSLEESENWGPGLFVDNRARASFDAAYQVIGESLSAEHNAPVLTDKSLRDLLLEACRHYWSDHDYDARQRLVTIREEVKCLNDRLDVLLEAMSGLSKETRSRLERSLRPAQARHTGVLQQIRQHLDQLQSVCLPIIQHRGAKKGSGRIAVTNCCMCLVELRTRLTGKPFSRTWTAKPSEKNTTDAFIGGDAQFVLQMIKAIDGKVLFSNVRSAGMSLTRSAARKK